MIRLFLAAALLTTAAGARGGVLFTNLFSFDGTNGSGPSAALMQARDGYFYGTTSGGGTNSTYGYGTVFKMDSNGSLTTLYQFGQVINTNISYDPLDGATPFCTLAQGSDGKLYGTTLWGGTNNGGTVFSITTNGTLTTVYSIGTLGGVADGCGSEAGLVLGSDGIFYGVANQAGTNGYGTVFRITTNGAFAVLHTFNDLTDGGSPYTAGLAFGNDGNLYGATLQGGANYGGTVFRVTASGALTTLLAFDGTNGARATGGLVPGTDGCLYGTTRSGQAIIHYAVDEGPGTVFRMTTNGVLTTLAYFDTTNGDSPDAPLVQGRDGNFYGTTSGGGTNGAGTVFRITPNGELTSLYSFAAGSCQSQEPMAGLVQGSDGNFYGTTGGGGTFGYGTVYRLTLIAPPAPVFRSIAQTNGTLTLTWSTEAGATYQALYATDANSTNWMNLGSAVTATGTTLSATDSIANDARRFYRVAALP